MKNDFQIKILEGYQKADKEAINQLYAQVGALYDYLGLTYLASYEKAVKIKKES